MQTARLARRVQDTANVRSLNARLKAGGYRSGRATEMQAETKVRIRSQAKRLIQKMSQSAIDKLDRDNPDLVGRSYERKLEIAQRQIERDVAKRLGIPRSTLRTVMDVDAEFMDKGIHSSRRAASGIRFKTTDADDELARLSGNSRQMQDHIRELSYRSGAFEKGYDEANRSAMAEYIRSSSVNKILRGQRGTLTGRDRDLVKRLDRNIVEAPEDGITYRGFNSPDLEKRLGRLRPGKRFADPGYGSTSYSRAASVDFADGKFSDYRPPTWEQTIMRVRVKKGDAVIYPHSDAGQPNSEGEVILPRNTQYRVRGVHQEIINGRPYTVVDTDIDTSDIADWSDYEF
jgi:hypothetical protein